MKKSTMMSLVSYLNGETVTNLDEIKAELEAELNKNAVKAQANRELYAEAHDVVMNGLADAVGPVTVSELYESIADQLPDGFTKGKMQYAMTRYWVDELIADKGSKGATLYSRKA